MSRRCEPLTMPRVEWRKPRDDGERRWRIGIGPGRLAAALLAAAVAAIPIAAAHAAATVSVLYAGSLVNLMERGVGPAFDKASGARFRGFAAGSMALANQIKGKLRRADVFISAAPAVNETLMGAANGDWVDWYITFAESPLVIGYQAHSKFAAEFKTRPWYQVLAEPGIRIGRTDPKLDPKGALTLKLMQNAERIYAVAGLERKVLGAPDNPAQVMPEEALIGRLQSGELDAGFFYSTETAEAGIPTVTLPADITPKAIYTLTVLRGAPNPAGAAAFVAFLLGSHGRSLLRRHGLALEKPHISGAANAVPSSIKSIVDQAS